MKPISQLCVLLALVMSLVACKKTVDSEQKRWDNNKQKVSVLKSRYTGYSSLIDEQLKKAEQAWADAEKISGDEEKIKKMAEANTMLDGGFIGNLNSIEYKKENIERKKKDLTGKRMDGMTSQKITDAENDLTKAQGMMSQNVSSIDDANRYTRDALNLITNAETTYENIVKGLQQNNNQNNTQNNTNTNATDTRNQQQQDQGRSTNQDGRKTNDNNQRSGGTDGGRR